MSVHRVIIASAVLVISCCFANSVRELDGESFHKLLSNEEADVLVLFHRDNNQAEVNQLADTVATRIDSKAIQIATYNVGRFGVPAGMHMHHPDLHMILFPAGGRSSMMYAWEDDDASYVHDESVEVDATGNMHAHTETCQHHHHDGEHDHEHEHHHHHHHATPKASSMGILLFLRENATFGREVPAPNLAEKWQGRNLFPAVKNGLAVIQAQMEAMQREISTLSEQNKSLKEENARLRRNCAGLRSS